MLIQCCASTMLGVLLYFCGKEQKKWVFIVVATASFMAGTKNLMKIIVSRFKLREVQLRIIEFYFE